MNIESVILTKDGVYTTTELLAFKFNISHSVLVQCLEITIKKNTKLKSMYVKYNTEKTKETAYIMSRIGFEVFSSSFKDEHKKYDIFNEFADKESLYYMSDYKSKILLDLNKQMCELLKKHESTLSDIGTAQSTIANNVKAIKEKQDKIDKIIKLDPTGPKWSKRIRDVIYDIFKTDNYNNYADVKDVFNHAYSIISERVRVKLKTRVIYAKKRARLRGASEKEINEITTLSVIENDKKLKIIFSEIVQDLHNSYFINKKAS